MHEKVKAQKHVKATRDKESSWTTIRADDSDKKTGCWPSIAKRINVNANSTIEQIKPSDWRSNKRAGPNEPKHEQRNVPHAINCAWKSSPFTNCPNCPQHVQVQDWINPSFNQVREQGNSLHESNNGWAF